MAKQNTDDLYQAFTMSIEDWEALPDRQQISKSMTEFKADSEQGIQAIAREAASNHQRMVIQAHDADSGVWFPLGVNPGHSIGLDPVYLLDYKGTAIEAIQHLAENTIGEITPDKFIIDVISDWRNPR